MQGFARVGLTALGVVALCGVVALAQPTPPPAMPTPAATATPVSPFAIPIDKEIGYRCESQQQFDAQWNFTGSLVIKVDKNGKITGGYLGDSDQDNPSYPPDPLYGRQYPVTGSITQDNKINLVIGSGSLQWNVNGTATQREINGNFSSTRFGLLIFYATRVHIPKHPANIQRLNP